MKRICDFADRLKEYRETSQLTLSDLEKIVGIPAQTLNRYELNQRVPKIDVAVEIAEKLDISPLWLQGYDVSIDKEKAPEPKTVQRRIMCYGGGVSEETVISEEEYETLQAVLKTLREQQKKRDASK